MLKELTRNLGEKAKFYHARHISRCGRDISIFDQAQELDAIRKHLSDLTRNSSMQKVSASFRSIKEIGPKSNDRDCEAYVFGGNNMGLNLKEMFPWRETHFPQGGDFVYYTDGKTVFHYGILQDDGAVISKWGRGPVFRHPIGHVPKDYGSKVRFFRFSQKEIDLALDAVKD